MDKRTEQFRAMLRSGQLDQAFVNALSQAVELEVTTIVNPQDSSQTRPEAHSRLNLLANQIAIEMSEDFFNHSHGETLKQFHQQQTLNANTTIQDNFQSLEQLHQAFSNFEQLFAEAQLASLPPSPAEAEDNMIDDLLDSLDAPEEEWEEEDETEVETPTPEVLSVENLEEGEEDWDDEEDIPPPEKPTDWQSESAEVDAMPTFEIQQVNWRTIDNEATEADSGTEADWDELDHELDLDGAEENP